MMAEQARGFGIINVYDLPIRAFGGFGIVELHGIAPDRPEVLIVAFLQGGGELVERHAEIDRRLVDARDADGMASLSRTNGFHEFPPAYGFKDEPEPILFAAARHNNALRAQDTR